MIKIKKIDKNFKNINLNQEINKISKFLGNNEIYVEDFDNNQIWGQIKRINDDFLNINEDNSFKIEFLKKENLEDYEEDSNEEKEVIFKDEIGFDKNNNIEDEKMKEEENEEYKDIDPNDLENFLDEVEDQENIESFGEDGFGETGGLSKENESIMEEEEIEKDVGSKKSDIDNEIFEGYNLNDSKFKKYEEKLVGEKSWELKGETLSYQRPKNALLDADLEFDILKKYKKVDDINELKDIKTTIESYIIQRINDEAYDDRIDERYSLYKNLKHNNNENNLNFEKNSKGLHEIYEEDYKNLISKLDKNNQYDYQKIEILKLFEDVNEYLNNMSEIAVMDGKGKYLNDEDLDPIEIHKNPNYAPIEDKKFKKIKKNEIRFETNNELSKEEKKKFKKKIERKKKEIKKRINKENLKEELKTSGLNKNEYNILKKNKSDLKKQINDSKVKNLDFNKSNDFIKNIQKIIKK